MLIYLKIVGTKPPKLGLFVGLFPPGPVLNTYYNLKSVCLKAVVFLL
jgi:hypothetical protein